MINPENKSFIENKNIETINSKRKLRYDILDNYKGILIFLVVFSHFLYDYSIEHRKAFSYVIVKYIYVFHMPSFIICSGFLSKSNNSRSLKALTKLILIYFIFNFLHGFILYLYKNKNLQLLCPYNSYWYLLCIIYWRFSIQYFANQYCSILISFIISILIGFWKGVSTEFSLKRAFSFFPYFLIGYKISKENFNKIIEIRNHFHIIIYSLFILFLFFSIKFFPDVELSDSMMLSSYNIYYGEDIKLRIKLFIFSFMYIIINVLILPNTEIPFITKIGKNSLFIYIFHRIFTIFSYYEIFSKTKNNSIIILNSLVFSIAICFIFGSNYFSYLINKLINYLHENLNVMSKKGKIIGLFFSFSFIGILMIQPLKIIKEEKQKELDIIKNTTLSVKLINTNEFEKAIRISYIGDLILLKDQVISAKNNKTGKYEFDEMFKNTWDYLKKSELSIGVYEGPSAGNKTSYSTSNYDDGIPLHLNFPDEFAKSVKKAGISLVTTANNHLLDKGIDGALRTIDILNKNNITHTGSYRSQKEKNQLLVLNISDIKFAILSYTSFINFKNIEKLYEKYPYLTSFIPNINNKYYNKILKEIEKDFEKAKNANPDCILVLVHMGTEFRDSTDNFQKKWNKIFSELGADIILGDHSHHVQPLEQLGNTFIVNSPGNFVNSYIKKNGDATSIVNLYFNRNTKKFIGSSIIPMYTQEYKPKYFRALPIFKIFNNSISITSKELLRIKEVQKLITKTMIGNEIPLSQMKEKYFFINNSYIDISNKETNIKKIIEKNTHKKIYSLINNSYSITFIGDSITEGTKNNFHPWYEPLIYYFKNKKIINISKGSYTTSLIIKKLKNQIIKSKSSLYIVALGANDVRYRNPSICAMNKEDYIKNIEIIVDLAKKNNKNSNFVFIAPWLSNPNDKYSKLKESEKNKLLDEYSESLKNYCHKNNFLFINPNKYINEKIKNNRKQYILDQIHPNENKGIELFSEAILINSN